MKYSKNEAKEAAKEHAEGRVDRAADQLHATTTISTKRRWRANLEHCISELKLEGHYCHGNVAEFWAMTNEERMRVHEINVDVNKGRVPLIAGCHHQNPNEVIKLAQHAQAVGIDFVIILTPYVAARGDDAIYEFYKLRLRADRHRRRAVQHRGDVSDRRVAREAAGEDPEHLRVQAGRIEDLVHDRAARRRRQRARGQRRGRSAVGLQHGRDGRPLAAQLLPAPLPGAGLSAGQRLHARRARGRLQQGDRDLAQPESAARGALEMDPGLRRRGRPHAGRTSRNTGWS